MNRREAIAGMIGVVGAAALPISDAWPNPHANIPLRFACPNQPPIGKVFISGTLSPGEYIILNGERVENNTDSNLRFWRDCSSAEFDSDSVITIKSMEFS